VFLNQSPDGQEGLDEAACKVIEKAAINSCHHL
jgi:hypothetical protein